MGNKVFEALHIKRRGEPFRRGEFFSRVDLFALVRLLDGLWRLRGRLDYGRPVSLFLLCHW